MTNAIAIENFFAIYENISIDGLERDEFPQASQYVQGLLSGAQSASYEEEKQILATLPPEGWRNAYNTHIFHVDFTLARLLQNKSVAD